MCGSVTLEDRSCVTEHDLAPAHWHQHTVHGSLSMWDRRRNRFGRAQQEQWVEGAEVSAAGVRPDGRCRVSHHSILEMAATMAIGILTSIPLGRTL